MITKRYYSLEKYWRKFMFSFFDYAPMKKQNATRDEWRIRKLIWRFKDGTAFMEVAQMVAEKLVNIYGEHVKNVVFACIPASSAVKNEKRYRLFSAMVCKLSGAINAYSHIEVEGERLAIHEAHSMKSVKNVEVVNFDKDFFAGKEVLIFDDILTRGFSYARFAQKLEKIGATILGGMFLGRTMMV